MIIKNMTITNSRGDSITFGHHFKLMRDFDLSGTFAMNNYSESTVDGSHYQNTKLSNKVFDIPFFIHRNNMPDWWIEEKRNEAYKVFNPKTNPLRIDIVTKAGEDYFIHANIDGAPSFPTGADNQNLGWQKGLLQFSANDPFFYTRKEEQIDVAVWEGAFEFPFDVSDDAGIEMGYRSPSLIVNVVNEGQDSTGMKIRFKALGTLTNPSLINVYTYEVLKINTTMIAGDVIEISTYKRKKSVTLMRNGVPTNIFNNLDLSSTFLHLEIGDNLFRYDAETGIDNLEVSINFTPRLIGV